MSKFIEVNLRDGTNTKVYVLSEYEMEREQKETQFERKKRAEQIQACFDKLKNIDETLLEIRNSLEALFIPF